MSEHHADKKSGGHAPVKQSHHLKLTSMPMSPSNPKKRPHPACADEPMGPGEFKRARSGAEEDVLVSRKRARKSLDLEDSERPAMRPRVDSDQAGE
jgi:hypothetical protein